YEPCAGRLREAQRLEELGLIGRVQLGNLRLDRGGERDRRRGALPGGGLDGLRGGLRRGLLGYVHYDEKRAAGEEAEVGHLLVLGVAPAHRAKRLAGLEMPVEPLELVVLRARLAVLLAQPVEALLDHPQIAQDQLRIEVAQIARGVRRRAVGGDE